MADDLKRTPDFPFEANPQDEPSPPKEHPLADPVHSFGASLGAIVDDARQIVTDLGLRVYRVFGVTVQWTGGSLGRGECKLFRCWELLPTPRIRESMVRGEAKSGGIAERGTITIDRISTRYTEEEVRGLLCSNRVADGQEQWIEVVQDARGGLPRRRRFIVSGQPILDLERGFQWSATLLRQDEDRSRIGVPFPYSGNIGC